MLPTSASMSGIRFPACDHHRDCREASSRGGVLEDRKPRHQACRQRRPPRIIGVSLPVPLLQKRPINRPPRRRRRMLHVDDMIQARAEKILLTAVSLRSRGRISPPRQSSSRRVKHELNLQGILLHLPVFRQITSPFLHSKSTACYFVTADWLRDLSASARIRRQSSTMAIQSDSGIRR